MLALARIFSTHSPPTPTPPPPPPPPSPRQSLDPILPLVAANSKRRKRVPSQLGQPPSEPTSLQAESEIVCPNGRRPWYLWQRLFSATNKVRSIILLNVITIFYASNVPVVKEIEAIIDPVLFSMVRFAVAAIPFIPFVAHEDYHTCSAGIELGLWLGMGYLTQALGLVTSNAGHASLISAFTVIIIPLIDGIFGATVPALTWYGALVSLVGVAMLECCGPLCVGDLLNLLSTVFFGIHTLRTEHISRSLKEEKHLALLGYEVCVVALLSTTWVFFRGFLGGVHHLSLGSWTWTILWNWIISFPWIHALYTAIFSTNLCLWAELAAMRDVSATETAIIFGLEPVWGAAFAWFFLGERWGITGWLGATLVMCGSLTVQILGSLPKKSTKDEEESRCNQMNTWDGQNDFLPVLVKS